VPAGSSGLWGMLGQAYDCLLMSSYLVLQQLKEAGVVGEALLASDVGKELLARADTGLMAQVGRPAGRRAAAATPA